MYLAFVLMMSHVCVIATRMVRTTRDKGVVINIRKDRIISGAKHSPSPMVVSTLFVIYPNGLCGSCLALLSVLVELDDVSAATSNVVESIIRQTASNQLLERHDPDPDPRILI